MFAQNYRAKTVLFFENDFSQISKELNRTYEDFILYNHLNDETILAAFQICFARTDNQTCK